MKLTAILLLLSTMAMAQKIAYTYSSSGNRTSRKYDINPFKVAQKDSVSSAEEFKDIVMSEGISVFPNPTNGHVVLTINNFDAQDANTMSLIDAKGTEIRTQKLTERSSEMNVSELRSGIYFFKVVVKEKILYYKLVKVD